MTEKTVIIYDCLLEEPVRFLLVEGDKRHLDRVYVNSCECPENLIDALNELVYGKDCGYVILPQLTTEQMIEEIKNGAYVIVAGFLP